MSRAIILAGGKASRFNGFPKELLPATQDKSFLELNIEKGLHMCGDAVVVTTAEKATLHGKIIEKNNYKNVKLVIQPSKEGGDMLYAIQLGQNINEDNILIMADTYFETNYNYEGDYLNIGIFKTFTPERFSVIAENKVYTKVAPPGRYLAYWAWGTIVWSNKVARNIAAAPYNTLFDKVLQQCMDTYNYSTFRLENYYDVGTFNRYKEYLQWIK